VSTPEGFWAPPPPDPALAADEIHVWRLALDLPAEWLSRLRESLAPDERARAARFLFEVHRGRFLAARAFLRAVLARYLGCESVAVDFAYGPHGKPSLAGAAGALGLRFNLSHSADRALLAITRGPDLGIDLEQVRALTDFEQLARRFFAPREVAALAEVPLSERERAFFTCWTRKEAYLKACGDGLARPLEGFAVALRPGEAARILDVAGDPDEAARWSLRAFDPWPGFVACVAVRGHGVQLHGYEGAPLVAG
jgi:4'-phosphopantetheinyl transferase